MNCAHGPVSQAERIPTELMFLLREERGQLVTRDRITREDLG